MPRGESAYWRRRRLIEASGLPAADQRLLDVLSDFQGENSWAWPRIEQLAERLNIQRSTVSRRLNSLIDRGIVRRLRRTRVTWREAFFEYQIDEKKLTRIDGQRRLPFKNAAPTRCEIKAPTCDESAAPTCDESAAPTCDESAAPYKEQPPKKEPKENPHTQTHAEVCVQKFYQLWTGASKPLLPAGDLALAERYVQELGPERLLDLLRPAVALMRSGWPGANRFVALEPFLNKVQGEQDRAHRKRERLGDRRRQEDLDRDRLKQERAKEAALIGELQEVWRDMSDVQRRVALQVALPGLMPSLLDEWAGDALPRFALEVLAEPLRKLRDAPTTSESIKKSGSDLSKPTACPSDRSQEPKERTA